MALILKHGVEAKNYETLAKAEKLKPLELELRRLEDLSDSIVQDFAFMRQREEEMRGTNGFFFYMILLLIFCYFRINECPGTLSQYFFYGLFACIGFMASFVLASLF